MNSIELSIIGFFSIFIQEVMRKILNCLEFGRDQRSYDGDVRTFCLTLHFYSPRAYNYVREKFNNNLPSISAVRNWYASLNASPGFTSESFDALKSKAEAQRSKNGTNLLCAVIFDEMSIRRHVQWDPAQSKYTGLIDVGRKYVGEEEIPLAKDALVYLVSGISEDFKIPVAYFFTNGLNADEKAAILNELLIRLAEVGVEVISITFDGHKSNKAMCHKMGANFEEGKGYIFDPVKNDRKIYIFYDPPHMLKLARNQIGSKILVDGDENDIQWKYIDLLYQTQKQLPSNLDNKLTMEHMQWTSKKMNVRLAAETLSSSVADALEFLMGENADFEGAEPTIKYIRVINDMFDIMNSTTSGTAIGFKRPISMSTYSEHSEKLKEAMVYLRGLQIKHEHKSIFVSENGTAFVGFYTDAINFMNIFRVYVKTGRLDSLIAHRFCQDHIESFFGCIRSMGGFNDNPTAQQFEAAYRKLLIHNDVICSKKSNTIDGGTKILTVSSHRPVQKKEVTLLSREEMAMLDDMGEDFVLSFDAARYMDDTSNHSLAYMASMVEKKICYAKHPKILIKCEHCLDIFIENELIRDEFIRFKSRKSNITQPCKSTLEICKFVDSFLKAFEGKTSFSFDVVLNKIMQSLPFQNLFTNSNFFDHDGEKNHKYSVIKCIVETFFNMKSVHVAKSKNLKERGTPIRHSSRKLIHELGQ